MKANALALIIAALYCLFLDWSATWVIFNEIKIHIIYLIMLVATVCFVIIVSTVIIFLKDLTKNN